MRFRVRLMTTGCLGLALVLGLPTTWCRAGGQEQTQPKGRGQSTQSSLRMTSAIVCRSIDGYDDYKPLPGAALTSDEKLLVYFRPLGYKSVRIGKSYQAHFTEDGQIRRQGKKAILRQKVKLLDYTTPKTPQPPEQIYLKTTVSLKGLEPGDYALTVILHDEIAKGSPATQIVKFRIIPAMDPRKADKPEEPDDNLYWSPDYDPYRSR
jgi:hypothetical protein